MFGLTPQAIVMRVAAFLLWSVACMSAGYLYKAHRVQVAQAAHEATQTTAQTTAQAGAQAADNIQIDILKSQLEAANSRANSLQRRIAELSHANPPAATCRLPDGLRDAINADLATGSR